MSSTTAATLIDQADRLVALGVHDLAGLGASDFRALVPEPGAASGRSSSYTPVSSPPPAWRHS